MKNRCYVVRHSNFGRQSSRYSFAGCLVNFFPLPWLLVGLWSDYTHCFRHAGLEHSYCMLFPAAGLSLG